MSKCKICHTSHTWDELDERGRCRSCRDAYMATRNGLHYGAYMAAKPRPYVLPVTATPLRELPIMNPEKVCRICGKPIPPESGQRTLCSLECQAEFNRQSAKAAKPDARPKTTPDGFERTKRGGIILNNDNDDARRVLETCYAQQKKMVNPIVDWEDGDIWEFIKAENVPYCGLYDEGFKRRGCIGCPMVGKHRKIEFERWPRYKQLYLNAFARMQEARVAAGKAPLLADRVENPTPQDIFDWWMEEPWIVGQMSMFEEGEK